jgi:LysR family transcriptional regulator, nitrogen assimilation regulatory protein
MISLRQIRSFVAVFEEGSFTAAADREGATQSGISQHVKQLEDTLGAILLVRDGRSVEPTAAGKRYYQDCIAALKRLDQSHHQIGATAPGGGEVHAGLMPTFTRGVLPPALNCILAESPGIEIRITEAYSGVLTDMVRKGELDFAIVPGFPGAVGLTTSLLIRDSEVLVAAKGRTGRHGEPIQLSKAGSLKIVLPSPQNTRRRNIDSYFATNGVDIAQCMELDAMMGTLEFVRASDWVAVLPSVIMARDFDGARYEIRPLADPRMDIDFVLIEPARRAMRPAVRRFADVLRAESERIIAARAWD